MSAFYNELDAYPAQWLRNLIAAGHITAGVVDERSIDALAPQDVAGYARAHFFAGIGVWDYALTLAGWPDHAAVWTGSCPCQPFSAAGKRRGVSDDRHLWPAWFRLIRECRPAVIFGEQVGGPAGLAWLDLVSADLEGVGYAVGAADLPAASAGAPHRRQRLYFVAYTDAPGRDRLEASRSHADGARRHDADGRGPAGVLADADSGAVRGYGFALGGTEGGGGGAGDQRQRLRAEPADGREPGGGVGDAQRAGLEGQPGHERDRNEPGRDDAEPPGPAAATGGAGELADADGREPGHGGLQRGGQYGLGAPNRGPGYWDACDWIPCRDGFARPVEPGTFPLVDGAPGRLGRLRAYGNAIVAPTAAAFVAAFMLSREP